MTKAMVHCIGLSYLIKTRIFREELIDRFLCKICFYVTLNTVKHVYVTGKNMTMMIFFLLNRITSKMGSVLEVENIQTGLNV